MRKQQLYVDKPELQEKAEFDPEPLLMVMRFLAGGTLEGLDELVRRLRQRQLALNQKLFTRMTIEPGEETELERWRYALLGLMAQAPEAIRSRLSEAEQRANRAGGLFSRLTSPVANSWLMRPLQRRYARWAAQTEARVERWIEIGRIEEQMGRELARDVADDLVNELLSYLADKPEVLQLIQQQSLSLTGEVVGRLRQRTAAADDWMDRLSGAAKRRSGSEAPELPLTTPPPAETRPEE
jgi:hypothetical protein